MPEQSKNKKNSRIQSRNSTEQVVCKHIFEDEEKQLKLPFTCFTCGVFYYNSSTTRKICIKCKNYECSICNIKPNSQAWIEKEFK